MKNQRNESSIVVTCLKHLVMTLLLVGLSTAAGAELAVKNASPASVVLTPGDRTGVSVALTGGSLDTVTSAIVLDSRGRSIREVAVDLGRTSDPSRRAVTLRATGTAAAGRYTLRLIASRSSYTNVSSRTLSIEITKPELDPNYNHTQLVAHSMDCVECHDIIAANVRDKFAWSDSPIVMSDVQAYQLHGNAYGATLEQVVNGQRKLRSDGVLCTSCHGTTPAEGTLTLEDVPKATVCSLIPAFVESGQKPNQLKLFLQNWKNRGCP